MGRVKEELLKKEEQDWVKEEQKKALNNMHNDMSILYADLLTYDDIMSSERIYITMINGKVYDFTPKSLIKITGLSIKIDYDLNQHIVLPLDKVLAVKYIV